MYNGAGIIGDWNKTKGMKVKSYYRDKKASREDIISGGWGFCPTASIMYPRKLMENPPVFFKTAHVGDYPMQLYLASKGYVYYIDDCMSVYRIGIKGSWTNRMKSKENIKEKMI